MTILNKLIKNSWRAIDDGTYDIYEENNRSKFDLIELIKNNDHASIISEIKFSSPSSKKIIKHVESYNIARSMLIGGAIGLSVLTQPYLFHGSPQIFISIRKKFSVPMLMKDIIVDKIQIDAATKIGADYILLIRSLFDKGYVNEIDEFIEYSHKKGLKIILETHTKNEFTKSLKTNADIIGINNRNLDTLRIDINITKEILKKHLKSRIIISESGISSALDIKFLSSYGVHAFLIGSSIMKSKNIEMYVKNLVNAI